MRENCDFLFLSIYSLSLPAPRFLGLNDTLQCVLIGRSVANYFHNSNVIVEIISTHLLKYPIKNIELCTYMYIF